MERPRIFLKTETTTSPTYTEVLRVEISPDVKGVSYFTMSIDPDPAALYRIVVGKLMDVVDLEITAVFMLQLPHLSAGVYQGFSAGDVIMVFHRSPQAISVKSGVALAFNEVVV